MAKSSININEVTIYGLVSGKEPNNIKYVGITRRKSNHRLNNHIYEAKKNPSGIFSVCNNKQKTYNGFKWKYIYKIW